MISQRLLGVVLIVLGLLTFLFFREINGAGILLALMGSARAVVEDEDES